MGKSKQAVLKVKVRVRVFEDPITCKIFEGEAVLIRKAPHAPTYPDMETWIVKFDGEDSTWLRKINLGNH